MNKLLTMAAVMGGVVQSPLMTGLIDYYKLDETSGNRLDSVGGRALSPTGFVNYATGILGNCAKISDGGNGTLSSAADATLLAIDWSLGFSVTGWFYIPTAYTTRFSILSKGPGNNQDWVLEANAVNSWRLYIYDSTSGISVATNTTAASVDTWYFIAGRYNPATKKAEVSVNGGAWTLGSALANSPKNGQNQLGIGRDGAAYGICQIDEVGLWTRYLSDAEVTSLYNGGLGKAYPF